ncbi:restriction endonuclease subunit S [Clostridium perfringens]|uniref:restriction endonuclease subunit S n=1 Tax=Clostridium perfringens TaxID=1502 RepID=UPI0006C4BE2E|nr:restriction endonuclease subunit S [Clostridium perfringens]EHK2403631.1 restriction endonuclease subunit S [Clostridium perfringens]MCX0370654.1 restriction endonuclease subunit S [Clostridium perfringens]MCX0413346.1 restriction endonuclease subunit S [Clostridium perfringens]MDM0701127.1 restriction endonuclease subunit S [Clostridium perfringens]MDM0894635.1 restriction endonuclease subunit S [Clostridium perfringens]
MNVYKLKEIFIEFKDGDWIESKNQSEDGIRLIQTGNIGNGIYIEKSTKAKFISEKTMEELNCNEIFEGDILISRLPSPVGRACILPNLRTRAITAVDCTIGRIDYKICNRKYFIYFTMSDDYSRQINKFVVGTTRKRISRKNLEEINISLPNIAIQNKIVEKLDIALELINKRKLQIKELDLLVKSKFIEMFRGDKNFDYIKIENLVEVKSDIVDGPFGSNLKTIDYVDSGVRVIQINNIGESQFRNGNKRYITEEKFNSLIKHSVIPGDIVVAKMGEPIGRACIVPNWLEKAVIVADCMKIHPDLNVINAKYLEFLLNTEEVKVQFKKYSQGSTRVRLNLTMLRQIEVLYPPIELQNQFADFVKQVDKLKFEMEQSLKELEDNFNSLMQKSFNI